MNRIVVVGNDKIGNMALQALPDSKDILFYVDHSANIKRIAKLLRRRLLPPSLVASMYICEKLRSGHKPSSAVPCIKSNMDLAKAIRHKNPDEVILFRAGLIVNVNVLSQGARVLNIHCARLPDYGGIGTIARALKDKQYDQAATLHIVTSRIDEGEIIKTLPYRLDPSESYCSNELTAYRAGVQLLRDYLELN